MNIADHPASGKPGPALSSAKLAKPANGSPRGGGAAKAWEDWSVPLAEWVDEHLVNRRDCRGGYYEKGGNVFLTTAKDGDVLSLVTATGTAPDAGPLTLDVIARHFQAKAIDDVIGLHAIEPGETCFSRWVALDLDRHEEGVDPDANHRGALAAADIARARGFDALVLDSDGRGGFHIYVVLSGPAPTPRVRALAVEMAKAAREAGGNVDKAFPVQNSVAPNGGFGSWIRLFGRHHKRDHHTRVWGRERGDWIEGDDAINAILGLPLGDPATLPEPPVIDLDAEIDRKRTPFTPLPSSPDDLTRAASALESLRDWADGYDDWIKAGQCLDEFGEAGFQVWHGWSRSSPEYEGEADCRKHWKSFGSGRGRTVATIFDAAQQKGWRNPLKGRPTPTAVNGKAHGKGHDQAGPVEAKALDDYLAATDAEMGFEDLADTVTENIVWLWEHRFLRGKINIIAGEGGEGKTTIALAVAAAKTSGGAYPDGKPSGEPGRVLIVAAEDGAADTIKPRLIAAGADLSRGRVTFLKARVEIPRKGERPGMVHPVTLQDLDYWRATFITKKPDILIVDPVPAYLGRGVNDHRNADVQTVLNRFAALALEFNVCVIAITHTGKAKDVKAVHKVLGSVAYTNCARVVHVIAIDPENDAVRYLARPKCNPDKPRDPLAYKIVSAEFEQAGKTFKTCRVEFDPTPVKVDIDTFGKKGASRGPTPVKMTALAEWLHDYLDGRTGWSILRAIIDAAGEAGHIGENRMVDGKPKWSNLTALYRAKDFVPSLPGDRGGRTIDEQSFDNRKHWKLLAADSPY